MLCRKRIPFSMSAQNNIELAGRIVTAPVFVYRQGMRGVYQISLAVTRLSGVQDVLPIYIWDEMLLPFVCPEQRIAVRGELRSYSRILEVSGTSSGTNGGISSAWERNTSATGTSNKSENHSGRSKLILYTQAFRICPTEDEDVNNATLWGQIARAPIYRRTPFGREICDIMLSVRRNAYKNEFLPVIVWGPLSRSISRMSVGDSLRLCGRFQSREYEKQMPNGSVDLRIAYELSCTRVFS